MSDGLACKRTEEGHHDVRHGPGRNGDAIERCGFGASAGPARARVVSRQA
jgi:hypothetical protein